LTQKTLKKEHSATEFGILEIAIWLKCEFYVNV